MNISDFLSQRAAQTPNALAALNEQSSLSYGLLERFVWQIATRLRRRGVRPGDRIGLCFTRQLPQFAVSLAAIRIGAIQVALPFRAAEMEIKSLIKRTGISLVASNVEIAAKFGLPIELVQLPLLMAENPEIDVSVRHEPGNAPFLLIPGSGTTGISKLIPILTSAYPDLLARDNAARTMAPGERHFSASTIDYYTALRRSLNCMTAGATCVFRDAETPTVDMCRDFNVDHLSIVPIHAQSMLKNLPAGQQTPALPMLKTMMIGGSPISEEMRHELRRRISPNLLVVYGANELGETTVAPPAMQDANPGCVGAPCGSMQIEIVDEQDVILPAGKIGHVRLKAPGLFPFYVDDEKATAKALRNGWYYPGDLGSLTADSVLIFQGRADDMMIFNGINIYPREIERILEMHPSVIEAAAFPVPTPGNYQVPAAAVAVRDKVESEELVNFCRRHIGNRAPGGVMIFEALPRNSAGKIMKRELASRFKIAVD